MDKRELIGFILNDIKELELIANGMHEMETIPEVMLTLAINKTQNIQNRFLRLKEEPKPEVRQPEEKVSEKPQPEKVEVPEEVVEPCPEIVAESIAEELGKIDSIQIEEEPIEVLLKNEPEIVEEIIQPEAIEPEEKKGTVFAEIKEKVQERTTNEKFQSRIPAASVVLTTNKRIESRFIQNLRKAINLNDRIRYQKELFGGNLELMNSIIDKLETFGSLEEAVSFVQTEFEWNMESQTVIDFYSLLESRFDK